MEYFIIKLQHQEILVWYPAVRGFKRIIPQPYFSLELAERVYKRICRPVGKYNSNFVQIVTKEDLFKLLEKYPKWSKLYKPATSIRGANFSDKGEIRGANYNDKGHTEVGDIGWMKYSDRLYNTRRIDISREDGF
jgi:hypothetical protein